ncbi:hypothetical protein TNCV_3123481 [Trichonephila clavipes]|nr:hypothetical protein TNCV_3123481 [Trichonephila clavipes]
MKEYILHCQHRSKRKKYAQLKSQVLAENFSKCKINSHLNVHCTVNPQMKLTLASYKGNDVLTTTGKLLTDGELDLYLRPSTKLHEGYFADGEMEKEGLLEVVEEICPNNLKMWLWVQVPLATALTAVCCTCGNKSRSSASRFEQRSRNITLSPLIAAHFKAAGRKISATTIGRGFHYEDLL